MILYSLRKLIKNEAVNYYFLLKILFISTLSKSKSKKIYIDISEIQLNRYLYNFIKFFTIEGYTVYLPYNRKLIAKLSLNKGEFKYASWILNENIKIGKPQHNTDVFFINKEQLSNDFFNSKYQDDALYYHVPMSKYPQMYKDENLHIRHDFISTRKNVGFMAGNFDKVKYEEISKKKYFDILNRREIMEHIYAQNYYKRLNNKQELDDFIASDEEKVLLLIDTKYDFSLSLSELLQKLEKFNFFIALPGVIIPQSHNLIEALGCGCIPILHQTYANLFRPPLIHNHTAIIYRDINDFDNAVAQCFLMTNGQIVQLRTNVIDYYKLYLSPSSIVEKIVNSNLNKIFIQAEHVSLDFLKYK